MHGRTDTTDTLDLFAFLSFFFFFLRDLCHHYAFFFKGRKKNHPQLTRCGGNVLKMSPPDSNLYYAPARLVWPRPSD